MPDEETNEVAGAPAATPGGRNVLGTLKGLFGKSGGGGLGAVANLAGGGKAKAIIPIVIVLAILGGAIFLIVSAIAVYASRLGSVPGYAGGVGGGLLTYPPGVDPATAGACLDNWVKSQRSSSPFIGKGTLMAQLGQQHNVNPAFMLAITSIETEFGTTGAGPNNPFSFDQHSYATIDEAINAAIPWMRTRYFDQGLDTIEKIGNTYAPIGAANDPGGTNKEWVPTVTLFFNKITTACPSLSSFGNFAITGPVDQTKLASWYYGQGQEPWGPKNGQCAGWPDGKIYRASGCGITSIAMIARYYGKNLTPWDVGAEFCSKTGRLDYSAETASAIIGKPTKHYDTPSIETLKKALGEGLVIARTTKGAFGADAHYLVIAGINGDNVVTNDPSATQRGGAGKEYPLTDFSKSLVNYIDVF